MHLKRLNNFIGGLAVGLLIMGMTIHFGLFPQWGRVFVAHAKVEQMLTDTLKYSNVLYNNVGNATVRMGNGCHGVLAKFNGEVILVTAAHCVRENRKRQGGSFKLSYYYKEETPAKNGNGDQPAWYIGFGSLQESKWDATFQARQVVTGSKYDIAFIRGVDIFTDPRVRARAIEIAEDTPQPMRLVFGIHWQRHCWALTRKDACREGEMLMPNLGLSRDYAPGHPQFFDYALAVYPGDSGSPIINEQGQLIGIVAGTTSDKAGETISTWATGPRTIRMFIRTYWDRT